MPASGLTNIRNYVLSTWNAESGVDPEANEEHEKYIARLCADFESTMRESIDQGKSQEPGGTEDASNSIGLLR